MLHAGSTIMITIHVQQLSTEIKQLQSEKEDVKSIADHESRKSAEQLRRLEAERKQQFLQMVCENWEFILTKLRHFLTEHSE